MATRKTVALKCAVVAALVGAPLGWMIPEFGVLVLAGVLAAPLIILLLFQPLFGVLLLVASLPLENLVMATGEMTGTRVLGLVVFGVWGIHKLGTRSGLVRMIGNRHTQAAILLLVLAGLSVLWATFVSETYIGVFSLAQLVMFSIIVLDVVQSWSRLEWAMRVIVLAAFAAAGFTLEQYYVQGLTRAGEDVAGGINGTAAMLVSALPFAFYLARGSAGFWRFAGIAYIPLACSAVAVTFSRASYIVLTLCFLAQFVLILKSGKGRAWLLLAPLAVVLAIGLAPQESLRVRAQSIIPAFQGMLGTASGQIHVGGDSRGFHWAVGLAMFRDYPLLGTGYNNFGRHFFAYQQQVPNPDRLYTGIRSPHSSYIAFLANQGVVGFLVWIGFLALTGASAIRLWSRLSPETELKGYLMVQALTLTFFLQLIYGWSMVVHQDKFFWLLLGLLAAARSLAGESSSRDYSTAMAEALHPLNTAEAATAKAR